MENPREALRRESSSRCSSSRSQLEQLTISDRDNLMDILNTIRKIKNTFASIGVPIADDKLFLTIIKKLPPKMSTIRDTILYGPDDRKTYEILEQTLLSYAKNNPHTQVPFLANTVSHGPKYCKHCKISGHTISKCKTKDHICKTCGKPGHYERRYKS